MVPFDGVYPEHRRRTQGRQRRHERFYLIRLPEMARLNNRKPTLLSIEALFVFLFLTELPSNENV